VAVFAATGDLKINAVAGSGKTTTLMALAAQAAEEGQRVTYIAFNKKVKEEAAVKAVERGLTQNEFRAVTAHGLAYRHLQAVSDGRAAVTPQDHKPTTLLPYLTGAGLAAPDRLAVAAHAGHVIRLFCNAQARQVAELNYLSVVPEDAMDFAAKHLESITLTARRVLAAMHKGELPMTHDFYLKRYALSNAIVPGDLLLFDEGQDASPAMLEVFLRSPGRKVIVGDRHQQIYGWRHAVNSLETVDFLELPLSASFRFPGEIAQVARTVVGWKPEGERAIQLRGRGRASAAIRTSAVLARTNTGLFEAALAYISSRERVGLEPKIEVAGNLHAMLSADSGGSIYDLVNLKAGQAERVKDEGLRALTSWEECRTFAQESGDPSLRALTRLVDEHGQRLPGMIQRLKRSMDRPGEAAMTFATVHQSKGMEYDSVVVWHDFQDQTSSPPTEEINILYVAVTRARAFLFIPDAVFNATPHEWADRPRVVTPYPVEDRDDIPARRGARWTPESDAWLRRCFDAGLPLQIIARMFGRTYTSIRSRLQHLELIEAPSPYSAPRHVNALEKSAPKFS
jgi:hypothetical protein